MKKNISLLKISEKHILHNIINLQQLVFEVTTGCNLKCRYCAFSDLYDMDVIRGDASLSFERAKTLIDYLTEIWEECSFSSAQNSLVVSFYGGEPLLNFKLIEKIVEYFSGIKTSGRKIKYSMTTNAILIDKYIDFLVKHDFSILVSLDGDENAHSLRVDHKGENSFNTVFTNIKDIQKKFPDFFIERINFNSVLHSKSSIESIYAFFKESFNKTPRISSISTDGLNLAKKREFECLSNNYYESFTSSNNIDQMEFDNILSSPNGYKLYRHFGGKSGNAFYDYNDLLFDKEKIGAIPTGTCTPFSKKMFLSASGNILQCEKINHAFLWGSVKKNKVEIQLNEIATKFNKLIFIHKDLCESCAFVYMCSKCIFKSNDEEVCSLYLHKSKYIGIDLSLLQRKPHLLMKIYDINETR